MRKLRNYRLRLGWSLDDVAQQLIELGSQTGEPNLGVNADMVGRWERGERRPRAPYPKLLAMLYGCSAEELGVHQAVTVAREVDQELSQWGAAGSVDVALAPVDLGDRQPDREGLICAMRGARRIAPKAVGVVGSAIASCRRLDDLLGSRVALLPALAQRDLLTSLLEAGQTEDVRPGLLTAASEVAQFLGWLAFDMGDDSAARTQFLAALQAAHEARDDALAAYILGYLSILATCTGEPHEGVAFAEAAQSRARRSATATTRSWLSTVEAEASAAIGDSYSTEQALERAEAGLDAVECEKEPAWLYHYGRAGLMSSAGTCYLTLNLPEASRKAIGETIRLSEANEVREQSLYLTALAGTYLPECEIEEACRCAHQALVIAEETISNRAVRRVRQLRGRLEAWRDEQCVRDLDEQLLRFIV